MRIERILAAVDLEDDTEKILAYASLFALAQGTPLHLLHVIDYLVTPPSYLSPYIEEEKKAAEEKFALWGKKLEEAGVSATISVVVGRLHESFASAVEKVNASMMVLGFRSHTFRLSSSENLIKGLALPMLVVRGGKSGSAMIGSVSVRRILCPTDFSGSSGKALAVAKKLQEFFSSEIDVVHILPGHVIGKKFEAWKEKDRTLNELLRQAQRSLGKFLSDGGILEEGFIVQGEPNKNIASFASQRDSDLIVIGARGISLIEKMLIGSVTDAVLKSSPCPVLVIH